MAKTKQIITGVVKPDSRENLMEERINALDLEILTLKNKLRHQATLQEELKFYRCRATQLEKYGRNIERDLAQSQCELQLVTLKLQTVGTVIQKLTTILEEELPTLPTFEEAVTT